MAESELGVLSSQCLDRRIPDQLTLIEEVAAWQHRRNNNHAKADWKFTTANARVKLKRLRVNTQGRWYELCASAKSASLRSGNSGIAPFFSQGLPTKMGDNDASRTPEASAAASSTGTTRTTTTPASVS